MDIYVFVYACMYVCICEVGRYIYQYVCLKVHCVSMMDGFLYVCICEEGRYTSICLFECTCVCVRVYDGWMDLDDRLNSNNNINMHPMCTIPGRELQPISTRTVTT